ncbi:MAG: NfeD family protein [Polyangiaceae bacterium]|nr:NfeD family protein [Polyangiaceae bacterium]
MGILYLAALIIGFGTIALQLAMGGDSHGDAEVGGDADAHLDAEADGDADHGHADHGHGDHGHGDGGFLPIFLSLRFWTFTFLAFGLSGSLVHYLDLAGSMVTLAMAVGLGLGAGVLASLTFRALSRSEANSGATASDAIGQVGRVLLPLGKGARGKVRIELKGQTVDYVATTDDEQLEAGQMVMIEEMRDTTAHVSRAPAELLPPKRES